MAGDGVNDGKFVIKNGGLSQAIVQELGLNGQQTKQLGSIWQKIFDEVDKQQQENISRGKSAIYSGGNDLKGDISKNYIVSVGQVVEFSKETWTNIIKLVNDKLNTNIQIANDEIDTDQMTNINFNFNFEEFCNKLSKNSPKGIAQALIDEIYGGRANLDEIMPKIKANNVLEVLEEYKKISDEKNTKSGVLLDDETLIEAILDETIPKEKKKEYINCIKDALIEKMKSLGYDTEKLAEIFGNAIDKILKLPTGLQSAKLLNDIIADFVEKIEIAEQCAKSGQKNHPSLDEQIYVNYLKEGMDLDNILGNGKFDKPSIQNTGNCWAHAGINALISTEAGKMYLDKIIHKNSNGTISVYLPGAKADGLPTPNGDGIYTYTEKTILDRYADTSYGDGDYTALMLAIEDYRKEAGNDPNATSDSGSLKEFQHLIFNDTSIHNLDLIDSKKDLKKAFEDGEAFYVSIKGSALQSILGYDDDIGSHAVAIKTVDTERDIAILIDSNQPETEIEVDLDDLLENCSPIISIKIP